MNLPIVELLGLALCFKLRMLCKHNYTKSSMLALHFLILTS